MYQVIIRARLRHAQALGIHPRRLLAYFAIEATGIPAPPSMMQLSANENIVTEVEISEPVLPAKMRRVERRTSTADTRSVTMFTDLLAAE